MKIRQIIGQKEDIQKQIYNFDLQQSNIEYAKIIA